MKSKLFLQLIISFLFLTTAVLPCKAAAVAAGEAEAWVNQTGYRLIEALSDPNIETKHRVLDEMFENNVDTEYMARFVLSKYWKRLDDAQKETYLKLFKRYCLSLYKSYPLDFDLTGLDFDVVSSKAVGQYTDISCRVDLPEKFRTDSLKSINVTFKLSKDGDMIKIVDLKIGESSLLLTYRNRFVKMVQDVDEELDWFLEDLNDLTLSNEKNAEAMLNS